MSKKGTSAQADAPTGDGLRSIRFLGNVLQWSSADKCLLVAALMAPTATTYGLMHRFLHGWLYLPDGVDPDLHMVPYLLSVIGACVWCALLVAGLFVRRRWPESRAFVHITLQIYACNTVLFLYCSGPFHSPGWITFLGGAIIGLLLFGRAATMGAVAAFLAIFSALLVLGNRGAFGDLPAATGAPPVGDPEFSWWMVRNGLSTTLFSIAVLLLCLWIINLMRDREAQLERLSKIDALTGVCNRRHFMELIEAEFLRAARYQNPMSCVMVDVDHFKSVNDRHGHLTGDRVLAEVSRVLEASVRDTDIVARYGGEEFVLLLPYTDSGGARELAERCRGNIATNLVNDSGRALSVTASMGIATFTKEHPYTDVDDLLRSADAAMYEAKRAGRNAVVVAAPKAS